VIANYIDLKFTCLSYNIIDKKNQAICSCYLIAIAIYICYSKHISNILLVYSSMMHGMEQYLILGFGLRIFLNHPLLPVKQSEQQRSLSQ